ncbi:hypothetical protein C8R46DRAFT_996013 [Mycena filopes]|nr:hypothetical protein C8R46DRAFT_996013 [Mycena filopes]
MDRGHSIHSGTYITAGTVNHRYGEAGIHILHRAVALEALHDSADSFPQPRCHPETRTKMLDDLFRWATATATEPNSSVLWLHGPAGAGKSAIMQTLCQRLHDTGRLGGSLFFKRGHATRGNAKALFSTLAYQLALHTQSVKSAISQIIEDDPSVVGRQMEVQLRKLILQPCQRLQGSAPPILLIDGLDECDTHSAQVEFLCLVGDAARDHNLPVKILVASRPESHIRETIESPSFRGLYSCFNVEQSFDDIATYFRDEFSRIHREHWETMGNIPTPWPSSETLQQLVAKSSGYFIYASTIIKFIDDRYFRPKGRLLVVEHLPDSTDCSNSPMTNLYELYTQILSAVPVQNRAKLGNILCVLTQFNLSLENMEKLLKLEAGDGRLLLRGLWSLIRITKDPHYPGTHHSVHTYHGTFIDFLEDPQHSSDFISLQTKKKVAILVLHTMSEEKYRTRDPVSRSVTSVVPSIQHLISHHVGTSREYHTTSASPQSPLLMPVNCYLLPDFSTQIGFAGVIGRMNNGPMMMTQLAGSGSIFFWIG